MTQYQEPAANSNSRKPYYIILIVLLLLINGVLFYNNTRLKRENAVTVDTLTDERNELQAQYDSLNTEMLAFQNITDARMDSAKTEIESKKTEIQRLLSKSNASSSELKQARSMIAGLRTNVDDYKLRISELELANVELTNQNVGLQADVQQKQGKIDTLSTEREALTQEKTQLTAERENLTTEKTNLTQRVNRANAVLRTSNISVEPILVRKSGKEVAVTRNERAKKVKVCFDLLPNSASKPGARDIVMRIMSPEGSPLAVESMGSGVFTDAQTGEGMQYTTKANVDYTGGNDHECMYWEQNTEFKAGKYKVELYDDGYFIGSKDFSLK